MSWWTIIYLIQIRSSRYLLTSNKWCKAKCDEEEAKQFMYISIFEHAPSSSLQSIELINNNTNTWPMAESAAT